mmetsp:Transcript_566/g.1633  ORF Transcript_566/g.1633 Transcript_566/m.1633 type:complete len:437 (+) Transcript_566:127-1437(+)
MGTYDALQLNLQSMYEKGLLTDVTLVTQGGREVRAHKTVLAAQSNYFQELFASQGGSDTRLEVPHKYKTVEALVKYQYFAGPAAISSLAPDECLDLMELAEELDMRAMVQDGQLEALAAPPATASRDLDMAGVPPALPTSAKRAPPLAGMDQHNCVSLLHHKALKKRPQLETDVNEYLGDHLTDLLRTPGKEDELLNVAPEKLPIVLRAACHHIRSHDDAQRTIQYCLRHTQLDSTCDLVRETKQWNWGADEAGLLRAPPGEPPDEGREWHIPFVRSALENTPARIVVGRFFDWTVRLDYGSEGRLRIVYESAAGRDTTDGVAPRCVDRFPAAMFAWRVIFRGEDVFHEKPVFICFPDNVSLHWSTTLPVRAEDLQPDDDLIIIVGMAENPMLSLILHHLSTDLKAIIQTEDILNRLPHIEYRCLSSYMIVKDQNH